MTDLKQGSVPQNKRSFTVAASPLNPVKFELGLILIFGMLMLVVVDNLTASSTGQLGYLVLYGLISMSWLIYRTRKILKNTDLKEDV